MRSDEIPKSMRYIAHYYGDIVRKLFVLAGIIMLLTLPFYKNLLPMPTFLSVLIILVIAIAAGATNPLQKPVMMFDVGVSLVAFILFEYRAVGAYGKEDIFFLIAQSLALIFFIATYFSIKTLRGELIKK